MSSAEVVHLEVPAAVIETPARDRGTRAVITTVFNKFGILFINASTGVITARALKPEGRGELAAMILWPLFLTFVTTLGIPSSLIYMLKRDEEGRGEYIAAGFAMTLILGLLAALIGSFGLPIWLGPHYKPSVIHDAQLFLLATPLLALTQTGRAVIEARGLFSFSNQLQLLYPSTTLFGLLLLLATHHLTPAAAALVYTGSALPNFLLMLYRVVPLTERVWRVSVAKTRLLLSYGVRSYGVDLLGTLALQVDQVLVISMLSSAQMGVYGVVLSLSRMFNLFQASIVQVLFPKAAGRSAAEVVALTERSARLGTMITAICSLLVSLVGSTLLGLLYGKQYANSSHCLQVLLVEVTLSGCVFILAQAFMALGRPGVVTTLQGLGLSLSIPLMLWLVPRYGVMGAAASLLISTCARLLFVIFGFRVFLKVPLPRLLPDRADFAFLLRLLSTRSRNSQAIVETH